MCIYQEITNRWLTNGKPLKNSRMFFENDKLYSYGYHYVIARIDRERNLVLINSNKSSPTTNRHKQIVRSEIRGAYPFIPPVIYDILNVPQPQHALKANLILLHDNLRSAIDVANKHMTKPNMQAVEEVADDFNALAAYIGVAYTEVYTDYLALKDSYKANEITIKWYVDDVVMLAGIKGYATPTIEQAREVLQMAYKYHDTSVLELYLDVVLEETTNNS